MTWARASSVVRRAVAAIAFRAFSARKSGADTSGPATPTSMQARPGVDPRLKHIEDQIARMSWMNPSDPRRGPLRKAIYSARHEILKERT